MRRAILLRAFLPDDAERTKNLYPIVDRRTRFEIDDAVLDALLGANSYHHGARSLEAILLMSRLAGHDRFGVASLPSDAQLALHVDGSFTEVLRKYASNRQAADSGNAKA